METVWIAFCSMRSSQGSSGCRRGVCYLPGGVQLIAPKCCYFIRLVLCSLTCFIMQSFSFWRNTQKWHTNHLPCYHTSASSPRPLTPILHSHTVFVQSISTLSYLSSVLEWILVRSKYPSNATAAILWWLAIDSDGSSKLINWNMPLRNGSIVSN